MKLSLRILFALVVISALCGFVLILLLGDRSATFSPLPNPNGYDDFVKAGGLITDSTNTPYEMQRYELSAFIATNAEALRLARLGLSRTCSVPTAEAITNFSERMNDLMVTKRLAQLLGGEGRLAEKDGRTNVAAGCYMDCIRLGSEISRGGFIIHRLVGIACEGIGCAYLAEVVPALNCETARPLIAELETMDKAAVTWEEVRRLERAFIRHEMLQRINPVAWIRDWWGARAIIQNAEKKHDRAIVRVRLLATELALRCYQSERGRIASRLDDLVPKYLQRVPMDPFSGQSLVYRAQGPNWLLYSIGPNGVDDGGLLAGKGWSNQMVNGDLFFDSLR